MKIGSCLELDSRRVIEQYKAKMLSTMTKGLKSNFDVDRLILTNFEIRYEV